MDRSQIQIATRIFHFILPPSPDSSPLYNDYGFNGTPRETSHALEDLPYPYNLPPSDVGYQEFFGEGGPGPSSAAALAQRAPPHFNAFTAPDGHGLGLNMTENNGWLNDWSESSELSHSSEDDSDSDDDDPEDEDEDEEDDEDDDDDEDEETGESEDGEEVPTPPVRIPKIVLRTKPLARAVLDDSDLSSVSSEGESEQSDPPPPPPPKKGKKQVGKVKGKKEKVKEKAALPSGPASQAVSTVVKEEEGSAAGKGKAGKQPLKWGRKQPTKAATAKGKAVKEEEAMDVDEVEEIAPATAKKGGKGQGRSEEVVSEAKATPTKKELKKKSKPIAAAPAPHVPPNATAPPPNLPPAQPAAPPAPVPTLAAIMASAPPPQPHPQPQTPLVRPPPPQSTPATLNQVRPPPASIPVPIPISQPQMHPTLPATAPPASAIPPVSRPAPVPGPGTPPTSGTGTPEPPKPFFLTELIENPDRAGHIVVNVPIPPSGAGPRPPPGPLIGLDGKPFIGPPPLKPTATFATIIHRALQYLPRGRGTLGEVCNWVAGEWEWFRLNIDAGWQNSIRHNLSLNKAFLKVPRIPEDDPESKGSVWIIDPEEGPLFEEKQRRDAQKAEGKGKSSDQRRERERIRTEERQKKLREMAAEQQAQAAAHAQAQARAQAHAQAQGIAPIHSHNQSTTSAQGGLHPHPNHPQHHPQQSHPHPQNQNQAHLQAHPHPQPHHTIPHTRPPPQRTMPVRPVARAQPPQASAHKPILQAKGKIVVTVQPITPALRAKSVITTTDANGNPLPFVCDGTNLVLEQATFGHLTSDIIDKLTILGAAGAVDVISAWVINKNKLSSAKAQAGGAGVNAGAGNNAAKAGAGAGTAGRPAAVRPQAVRPPSKIPPTSAAAGTQPGGAVPAKAAIAPGAATANANAVRPVPPTTGSSAGPTPAGSHTHASGPGAGAGAVAPKPPAATATTKPLPGAAPPGASLTKVISMIAEVANAKGDVNTVGPNASALLRYIRVVGVDIDLKVAERIWATGVVPPLPARKGALPAQAGKAVGAKVNGSTMPVKPNPGTNQAPVPGGVAAAKPKPALVSPNLKPATASPSPGPASITPSVSVGMKRKLDDGVAGPSLSTAASAGAPGSGGLEAEVKKAKIETAGA